VCLSDWLRGSAAGSVEGERVAKAACAAAMCSLCQPYGQYGQQWPLMDVDGCCLLGCVQIGKMLA